MEIKKKSRKEIAYGARFPNETISLRAYWPNHVQSSANVTMLFTMNNAVLFWSIPILQFILTSCSIPALVLISDGNSEIGARVRSNIYYLICLSNLLGSRTVKNPIFSPKRPIYLHTCATSSELPSVMSSMIPAVISSIFECDWKSTKITLKLNDVSIQCYKYWQN